MSRSAYMARLAEMSVRDDRHVYFNPRASERSRIDTAPLDTSSAPLRPASNLSSTDTRREQRYFVPEAYHARRYDSDVGRGRGPSSGRAMGPLTSPVPLHTYYYVPDATTAGARSAASTGALRAISPLRRSKLRSPAVQPSVSVFSTLSRKVLMAPSETESSSSRVGDGPEQVDGGKKPSSTSGTEAAPMAAHATHRYVVDRLIAPPRSPPPPPSASARQLLEEMESVSELDELHTTTSATQFTSPIAVRHDDSLPSISVDVGALLFEGARPNRPPPPLPPRFGVAGGSSFTRREEAEEDDEGSEGELDDDEENAATQTRRPSSSAERHKAAFRAKNRLHGSFPAAAASGGTPKGGSNSAARIHLLALEYEAREEIASTEVVTLSVLCSVCHWELCITKVSLAEQRERALLSRTESTVFELMFVQVAHVLQELHRGQGSSAGRRAGVQSDQQFDRALKRRKVAFTKLWNRALSGGGAEAGEQLPRPSSSQGPSPLKISTTATTSATREHEEKQRPVRLTAKSLPVEPSGGPSRFEEEISSSRPAETKPLDVAQYLLRAGDTRVSSSGFLTDVGVVRAHRPLSVLYVEPRVKRSGLRAVPGSTASTKASHSATCQAELEVLHGIRVTPAATIVAHGSRRKEWRVESLAANAAQSAKPVPHVLAESAAGPGELIATKVTTTLPDEHHVPSDLSSSSLESLDVHDMDDD